MLAIASGSRMTCAWFHMRSSATNLAVSVEETILEVCAQAHSVSKRQISDLMPALTLESRVITLACIDCDTIARAARVPPSKKPPKHYQCHRGGGFKLRSAPEDSYRGISRI